MRSKQWRSNELEVSGGATVWVLYLPEDENIPQCIETWIPFQMRWDVPAIDRDGVMNVECYLRFADARIASSRRMIVRAGFGVSLDAFIPREAVVYVPDYDGGDLQMLKNRYAVCVPKESGEKTFALDEELNLPASCPEISKILRYDMQLEITDKKVLSQRVVFRGTAILKILYCADDRNVHQWNFEFPFSQYADLENDHEADAVVQLIPAITGLELVHNGEGNLLFKAGVVGQYTVFGREFIEAVQDAYSIDKETSLQRADLVIPSLLHTVEETLHLERQLQLPVSRVVDSALYLEPSKSSSDSDKITTEICGILQVLYYNNDEKLQNEYVSISEKWETKASDAAQGKIQICASGMPLFNISASGIVAKFDVLLNCLVTVEDKIDMIASVELGDVSKKSTDRPSLILCRVGDSELWGVAKKYGSTVQAIIETNDLQGETFSDRMLIIPMQ